MVISLMENDPNMASDSEKTALFVRDWTENARRVYAYIFSLVPNWADAEEVFQDTSAVLWLKHDDYRPGSDFLGWAFRVAYYKVLEFRKASGKNVLRLSEAFVDAIDRNSLTSAELWTKRHRLLADCYDQLAEQDRQVLDLRYEPGATTKGVAHQLGRSVDAIYKALNRIHDKLLDCINAKLEELP
jgi:RNA polymerase sigma-70 factor, ECF subfamily